MPGHVFIAPGDITQLSADAVAYSASNTFGRDGNLYSSFEANVPGFAPWYDWLRKSQKLPCPLGSTFWLPLDPGRKPRGVVVVVAAGGPPVEDKAGLAVRSALTEAVCNLRAQGHAGRLLVGLPAFRVGKAADQRQRHASARAQLAAARDALPGLPDVDVAFLTYTPTLYQIFLQARREVLGAAPAGGPGPPELEKALREGECVLFVGAGLSSGAGLPSWDELIRRLAGDLGIAPQPRLDYLDLAQWYRDRFGNRRLGEVVRETFAGAGLPTLAHYLLLALPVRHVITTNYDDLLERALGALKRHPVPVVRQEDVARTGQAGVYVVKLHGDATHPEDVVLSRDDYHEFFERRPAMALLLEGLLLNQTFFFVGYGLRDPNFRQVFSRIARMLREARRPAFATTFEAGGDSAPYLRRQWARQQLHLIPIPGADTAEQKRAFLLFLDDLADRVSLRQEQLLLAPDVPAPAHLEPLRGVLEQAGAQLEELAQRKPLTPEDVRHLAGLLEFLTAHGWRPRQAAQRSLCRLWEALADGLGGSADPGARRPLLIAALGSAETFADARRVRAALAELDKSDPLSPGASP
jgi:hypothetical protein